MKLTKRDHRNSKISAIKSQQSNKSEKKKIQNKHLNRGQNTQTTAANHNTTQSHNIHGESIDSIKIVNRRKEMNKMRE